MYVSITPSFLLDILFARALYQSAARMKEAGRPFVKEAAMAKLYTSQARGDDLRAPTVILGYQFQRRGGRGGGRVKFSLRDRAIHSCQKLDRGRSFPA